MTAPEPGRESFFAWADRVTDAEEAERGAAPEPGRAAAPAPEETSDPFGGHEFHYESHTDLFRCIRCHAYEVTARAEDGSIAPCPGRPPEGSGPIEVNAW